MTEAVAPTAEAPAATLDMRFPGAVTPDTRAGYSGYVVTPEKLIEVATAARDEMGYDYLSSVTGVDYLTDGKLEAVYHLYRTSGGPALALKVQTPRDNPVVPSLVSIYPGADFQEREAYDMYGIRFAGHPNLKRILMWEGFGGWPLRKDWKEAYYEQDTKPFDTRWPGGHFYRSEEKNPFAHNVVYPEGFLPEGWVSEAEASQYPDISELEQGNGRGFKTDKIVVNLGPQHPSTHGVFRMVVTLDGETIVELHPVMGYLHRNHEKIGERNTWLQNMPFTDRLDYISSMSNNLGYALAVEKLQKLKVPERAEYIRVLMVELTRICNHMWAVGFLLNDLGAFFTPALYAIRERELILDFFEATAGSRMMCNYMRFGGVSRDIPEKMRDENTMDFINDMVFNRLPKAIDDLDTYLTENEIIRSRCLGVGVLPADQAIAYSTCGPLLRASGVPYDIRRAEPYSIYDRFDFKVCTRPNGDIYDRYLIRMDEMRESVKICQQVLRDMPAGGEIMAGKPQYNVRAPAGESYGRVEGPKGELGFYVVSTGKANPYRYHVRAPSFINLTVLGELCKGAKVADVVVILGSIDIVLGETDR
ncbi:MAG TPA: NADH-quinone oxidoreductase subunit D [Anaerolineales bacterium]|nr:NADH-quinone oxidoreductase subunit D [Anaerolineales bacterium]